MLVMSLPGKCHAGRRRKGFTIIELMVALAIAGVIALVAIPNYLKQVRKSRRADATIELLAIAAGQERFFTDNNRYTGTLGTGGLNFPASRISSNALTSEHGHYAMTITATGGNTFSTTASATGGQTKDDCDKFTLDHRGIKGVSGGSLDDCW